MRYLLIIFFFIASTKLYCQVISRQTNEALIQQFYKRLGHDVFWYDDAQLRIQVRYVADSLPYWGIRMNKFKFPGNDARLSLSNSTLADLDREFTSKFIDMMRDMLTGSDVNKYIKNDEVSKHFVKQTDSILCDCLFKLGERQDLRSLLLCLEPNDSVYTLMKADLHRHLVSGNAKASRMVTASLNIYKWMRHFNFEKYIVVNIPEAYLTAFRYGRPDIRMKVIVGKPKTRTPRFSTWCHNVILYPYWNVPASIAQKELVPLFKRNLSAIGKMNMQIIAPNGKRIDPYDLNWSSFSRNYFPYTVRQCTGCDNALGVIKFDLTDPFNVYMHDTNYKLAFGSSSRYFSHGCIRVSQPIELGNYILENKLDSNFLLSCYKNQQPSIIKVTPSIPVFVVYMAAFPENGHMVYYKDVYGIFR